MDTNIINNKRDSNIELLRLICMFLIVLGHFICHGIINKSQQYQFQDGWDSYFPQLLYGFAICAVDTFVLISGYYGIRPKARSFFNLYLQCAFYAGILYLIHLYLSDSHINRWCIYNTLFPFSNNPGWWFIPQYVILYTLSPILNKIVDNTNKRQLASFLILMAIVVFYFGHYRQYTFSFAESGFNFINFIFLYFIGRYLSQYVSSSGKRTRLIWGSGYIISALLIGLISWAHLRIIHSWNPIFLVQSYSHPLCVLEAVCLFMFATTFKLNSRLINWFGSSSLSIYLLHECVYYRDKLYQFIANIYDEPHPYLYIYCILIVFAVATVVICPVIDKVRIIVTNPINNKLCQIWEKVKKETKERLNFV